MLKENIQSNVPIDCTHQKQEIKLNNLFSRHVYVEVIEHNILKSIYQQSLLQRNKNDLIMEWT